MSQLKISVTAQIQGEVGLVFTQNPNLPTGVPGQAYPATSIGSTTGGLQPYTYTATGGLPSTMSLTPQGVLSGTWPSAGGNIEIAMDITDSTP